MIVVEKNVVEFTVDVETVSPTQAVSPTKAAQGELPTTGGPGAPAVLLSIGTTLLAVAGTLIVARKRLFG